MSLASPVPRRPLAFPARPRRPGTIFPTSAAPRPGPASEREQAEEARFRAAIPRSWRAVWAVAQHYHAKGYAVWIPPLRIRKSQEEREGYGDDCDLVVGDRWRFEVKWREVRFTCAEDFPYPTVFVDRVEKADKVCGTLTAYISVNKNVTHAALIPASSRESWVVRERMDRTKGYPLSVYECPKELVRFERLESAGFPA